METIKEKTLTFMDVDAWSRPLYKDENGRIWADISPMSGWKPELYTVTDEGEPDMPMKSGIKVTFVPHRIVWR